MAVVLTVAAHAATVYAACDVIPAAIQPFRAATGTIDRPFASPGEVVEVGPDRCLQQAGITAALEDIVVSVVFKPPGRGRRTMVVLSPRPCSAEGLAREIASCAKSSGADVRCEEVTPGVDIEKPARHPERLRFRFPDTDRLLGEPDDDLTLAGAALIAVTGRDALPCNLVKKPCGARKSLFACIDELRADGTCAGEPNPEFSHFTALPPANDFAAVCSEPAFPNGPCTSAAGGRVRIALDAAGNLVVPVDWRGVLVRADEVPVARLLEASTTVTAFAGLEGTLEVPSSAFLESFSPEGHRLPPLFEQQADLLADGVFRLFGSADAPTTVLRISRRAPRGRCSSTTEQSCAASFECPSGEACLRYLACAGGTRDGRPCVGEGGDECGGGTCGETRCTVCTAGPRRGRACRAPSDCGRRAGREYGCAPVGAACGDDAACPGSQCGPPLFDFTSRVTSAVGPLEVADVFAAARAPVPLDGFAPGGPDDAVNVLVREERLERVVTAGGNADLNGDGDTTDPVLTIQRRASGATVPIGDSSAVGRAVARISDGGSRALGFATEGGIVAFLEPEPLQGGGDTNANGQVFETILRAFTTDGIELTDGTHPIAADAAPVIDGRSVVISSGRVFFRASEAASAPRETIDLTSAFGTAASSRAPSLTTDGTRATFVSTATPPGAPDVGGNERVLLADLATGTIAAVLDPPAGAPEWLIGRPLLSGDGSAVAVPAFDRVDSLLLVRGVAGGAIMSLPDVPRCRGSLRSIGGLSNDGRRLLETLVPFIGPCYPGAYLFQAPIWEPLAQFADFVDVVVPGVSNVSLSPDGGWMGASGSASFVLREVSSGRTLWPLSAAGRGLGELRRDALGRPALSVQGRHVALFSERQDLVAGDTNGAPDVFVAERDSGFIERVSLSSTDAQLPNGSGPYAGATTGSLLVVDDRLAISSDGRFVAFAAVPQDLGVVAPGRQVFLRDRTTGHTVHVSVFEDLAGPWNGAGGFSLSGAGDVVAFEAEERDDVVDKAVRSDVLVRRPVPGSGDLTGDGDNADVVLAVLEAAHPGAPTILGPADVVAVHDGAAAFLAPESAGAPGSPGGIDRNGDGDTLDRVVALAEPSGTVTYLDVAASAVALSAEWIVALVSETAQGEVDRNGDGDVADDVVALRRRAGGPWMWISQAAATVAVNGSLVVFTAPETSQGMDMNGDGDRDDRVLQAVDAEALERGAVATLVPDGNGGPAPAIEDFVIGGLPGRELVVFRTSESADPAVTNGDGDREDDVLQVFDRELGTVVSTGRSVRPCLLEACDRRMPYRVGADAVTFLVFELDESAGGTDLDGNGRTDDFVLATVHLRSLTAPSPTAARAVPRARGDILGATAAGVCTGTGRPCFDDRSCAGGVCFVPPGRCLRELDRSCAVGSDPVPCSGRSQFCQQRASNGAGRCIQQLELTCVRDGDCRDPRVPSTHPEAYCVPAREPSQRLVNPFERGELGEPKRGRPGGGSAVFAGAGRCVEELSGCGHAAQARCPTGAICARARDAGAGLVCQRAGRVCTTDADCPGGVACRLDLLTSTAADSDGDEVLDAFDNCPGVRNGAQEDGDGDGAGDACDPNGCAGGTTAAAVRCRLVGLVDATLSAIAEAGPRSALARRAERARMAFAEAQAGGRRGARAVRRTRNSLRAYIRWLRALNRRGKVASSVAASLAGAAEGAAEALGAPDVAG